MDDIIPLILSAISGGVIAALATHALNRRQTKINARNIWTTECTKAIVQYRIASVNDCLYRTSGDKTSNKLPEKALAYSLVNIGYANNNKTHTEVLFVALTVCEHILKLCENLKEIKAVKDDEPNKILLLIAEQEIIFQQLHTSPTAIRRWLQHYKPIEKIKSISGVSNL